MMEKSMIYREDPKQMYNDAIRLQDACNPIAITGVLRDMLIATDRDINNPAVIATFDKIADLLGRPHGFGNTDKVFMAFNKCYELRT